jgi:hypothetical protein
VTGRYELLLVRFTEPQPEGRCITLAAPSDFPGLALIAGLFACHNCDAPKTSATPIGVARFTARHTFQGAAAKTRTGQIALCNQPVRSLAKRNAAPLRFGRATVGKQNARGSESFALPTAG